LAAAPEGRISKDGHALEARVEANGARWIRGQARLQTLSPWPSFETALRVS
jgi:hypothetical protein